ncbi:MAG: PaaI family thioesterase [Clostridiales bacterium]|nr:PaaI family thioesterase [Clostridiales bacterium]MBR5058975.1 PaaI family thioesterase [Clostridiales bacterium]
MSENFVPVEKRDLEWARKTFADDRFATEAAGVIIEEAGDKICRCSMRITPVHRNAAGGVMGGAIFTLADLTFAVAANFGGRMTVSISSNISFVGPAKGEVLMSTARCIKSGRSACFYEVEVVDDLGNKVAIVTFTGFVKDQSF